MHSKELQALINSKFDDDVLMNIVKKKTGWSSFEIKKIVLGEQSRKGDSYLSTVTRFVIEAVHTKKTNEEESCSIQVITKALPQNLARRKTFRSLDFFNNEIAFYSIVWPALCAFQSSKNIKNPFDDIPMLLTYHQDGVNDFIALEDLTYKGYTGIKRELGLDFKHAELILNQFAKFHALSYAFKDQQSENFEAAANCLQETYFAEEFRPWYINFQKELHKIIRDAVARELPVNYIDKFDKLVGCDFYGKLIKLCEVKGKFASITHGDAWIPNFMVLYDKDQTPLNIKLIDFQLARYASVSLDILFVLYACVDQTLREKYWDTLIQIYFKTYVDFIKELGSDVSDIKIEDLYEDIKLNINFGLGMAMEANTMSLLEDNEVADIDEIQGTEQVPLESVWILYPFKCNVKRLRLANVIKHAVDKKFI